MKKTLYYTMTAFLLCAISFASVACSSDDEPIVYHPDASKALAMPTGLTLTEATTAKLSFSWNAVDEAVQYGYTLLDKNGKPQTGGTTNNTNVTISGLKLFEEYTIEVVAFPAIACDSRPKSPVATLSAKTLFYDILEDVSGNYTTYLNNADGETWTAILNEDRSAADYVEGTFGVFTLRKFFNNAKGSIVFTVDSDNKIKILNATGYDENGWAMVSTGRPQGALKTIYIDESSSEFDREGRTLSYTARLRDSAVPMTDEFVW